MVTLDVSATVFKILTFKARKGLFSHPTLAWS